MTVKISQQAIIHLASGTTLVLTSEDKAEVETTVEMTCDGPRCAQHNGDAQPTVISFIQEQVGKDPTAVPDGFARLIKLGVDPFAVKEYSFCGPRCVKDWLDYSYVPPKSPRERTAELQAEQKAMAAIEAANGGL